eukprot:Filipodium_phascolosomae@DN1806_c0_g1_i1.p2
MKRLTRSATALLPKESKRNDWNNVACCYATVSRGGRVSFAEDRVLGEEAVYFKKLDDDCLKKLLEKHPEIRTDDTPTEAVGKSRSPQDTLRSICKAHNIHPDNGFIRELEQAMFLFSKRDL